jgi:ABC-type amino acid transport substrate-binding protein
VGPFAYNENGQLHGYNFEILNELAKKSGLKFRYQTYPHIRLTTSLDSVAPDLTIFFSASCLKFSTAYEIQEHLYSAKPTLFLKESVSIKSPTLRIGAIRGTCLDLIKNYLKHGMITEISDMKQALEMLNTGRLDGVCGLPPVVRFSLEKNKNFEAKIKPFYTESQTLEAVLCRRKDLSVELKKKLEVAVKKIKIPQIN